MQITYYTDKQTYMLSHYSIGFDIFFRDLKPMNLLVDKNKGLLKIGDLGLGRAFTVPVRRYTREVNP